MLHGALSHQLGGEFWASKTSVAVLDVDVGLKHGLGILIQIRTLDNVATLDTGSDLDTVDIYLLPWCRDLSSCTKLRSSLGSRKNVLFLTFKNCRTFGHAGKTVCQKTSAAEKGWNILCITLFRHLADECREGGGGWRGRREKGEGGEGGGKVVRVERKGERGKLRLCVLTSDARLEDMSDGS